MTRKINVILIKDNHKKGNKGNIINVSCGYAFNYLIPNKIAELATTKKIKHIKMFEEIKRKNKEANDMANKLVKEKIDNIKKISIYKKKGENNFIFGTITEKDIINWLEKNTTLKINKNQIKIPEIKEIGINYIEIQITSKITSQVILNIIPINI
uniref:Large ribosomal subunit protein bL9c n=1 Tax=Thaumatella adunca TaxID=2006976 RepID=A0A1Z1MN38_9FLOR|nr:ribosomal protein L9 [Thaumatella adunca]ARW67520.1 ribosomal protein L9 [Thaumatella adunca]